MTVKPNIHTITLNPAIDLTIKLEALTIGEVSRAYSARQDPGGKGITVASCLADWGMPVVCHGLIGNDNEEQFTALFVSKNIEDKMVRLPQSNRTNIKLLENGGRTTDVNLLGFNASRKELDTVKEGLSEVGEGAFVVISGSQPRGLKDDDSAQLAAALKRRGARVILDVSGVPLREALKLPSDAMPFAIKPNISELEACLQCNLSNRSNLVEAIRELIGRGIRLVVVSLGAEGAIFASTEAELQVVPATLSHGSTVGAGDAMIAGIISALVEGLTPEEIAVRATAFSMGKLQNNGPHLPNRKIIHELEKAVVIRPLSEWMIED